MGVSKVVYGGRTLIDLNESTVSPSTLIKGTTAFNAAGELIEGSVNLPNCFVETASDEIPLGHLTFAKNETKLYFKTDDDTYEIGSLKFAT